MNRFFIGAGLQPLPNEEEKEEQKQQRNDTRRPPAAAANATTSTNSLFGDQDYSSGGIQYRYGGGGGGSGGGQPTRSRSKSFSDPAGPPAPELLEQAAQQQQQSKPPPKEVSFAEDTVPSSKVGKCSRAAMVERLKENLRLAAKQQQGQQPNQQLVGSQNSALSSNGNNNSNSTDFFSTKTAPPSSGNNSSNNNSNNSKNDYNIDFSSTKSPPLPPPPPSSAAQQHVLNNNVTTIISSSSHTFSSQQLATMKTVVYLDLKTETGGEVTDDEAEEAAAKAACPLCAMSQPVAHWHYVLPNRATYQVEVVPRLVDALPTSCSVCARVPRGGGSGSGNGLKLCSKCRAAVYCSEVCQLEDWQRGHGKVCERQSGQKVVKCLGEVEVVSGGLNGGQQQQQQRQQFNQVGNNYNSAPYRGHQQQFFNRQRVRNEMYQQQQQNQQLPLRRNDDFFLNRFNNQSQNSSQAPPNAAGQQQATVPVSASAVAPAKTSTSTPVPVSTPAPVPITAATPTKMIASPAAAAAATKFQLKPVPMEAMQHAELKDVTDGPWKRGGLKDAPMEVPAFPREFLGADKKKEEKEAEKEKEEEVVPVKATPPAPASVSQASVPPKHTATKSLSDKNPSTSCTSSQLHVPSTSDPPPPAVSPFAEKYFDGVVSKLPRYKLATGKAYNLMPVHMEESVDRKRLHFYVAYRDFIGHLMVEIGKVSDQAAPVKMAAIEAGDIYLVKSDHTWLRAQVLRITSTAFYIEYIDFGNRKYVDKREVVAAAEEEELSVASSGGGGGGGGGYFRQLPPSISIKRQPPTAIRLQVRNIPSFQQFKLLQRLIAEANSKFTLLKLFVLEHCPETDCYTVQFDEI